MVGPSSPLIFREPHENIEIQIQDAFFYEALDLFCKRSHMARSLSPWWRIPAAGFVHMNYVPPVGIRYDHCLRRSARPMRMAHFHLAVDRPYWPFGHSPKTLFTDADWKPADVTPIDKHHGIRCSFRWGGGDNGSVGTTVRGRVRENPLECLRLHFVVLQKPQHGPTLRGFTDSVRHISVAFDPASSPDILSIEGFSRRL